MNTFKVDCYVFNMFINKNITFWAMGKTTSKYYWGGGKVGRVSFPGSFSPSVYTENKENPTWR